MFSLLHFIPDFCFKTPNFLHPFTDICKNTSAGICRVIYIPSSSCNHPWTDTLFQTFFLNFFCVLINIFYLYFMTLAQHIWSLPVHALPSGFLWVAGRLAPVVSMCMHGWPPAHNWPGASGLWQLPSTSSTWTGSRAR